MALNIKHPEADRLARALAARTGETITGAVIQALRDRLQRTEGRRNPRSLIDDLREISDRCAALPVLDTRSADEVLGYDEIGVPR